MKHFNIKEFQCHCGCEMPAEAQQNIEILVKEILDPVRSAYGQPIYVNSGYRCPQHNLAVGGTPSSHHLNGQAADITTRSTSGNLLLSRLLEQNGHFDQMILYVEDVTMIPRFLHISHNPKDPNRHQILKKVIGKSGYQQIA